MVLRTTARVVALERVTVPAGTYSAYKLQITTHAFNPDYDIDEGFEYYVPNVGLVLKQSDMVLNQWNSETNATIVFRQIIKQQLLAVNFIRG